MKNLNVKSFEISEIQNISPDIRILNSNDFLNNSQYTVSDYLQFEVHTGSENLYFDLMVYAFECYTPQKLRICTKDDHKNLKKLIKHFLGN